PGMLPVFKSLGNEHAPRKLLCRYRLHPVDIVSSKAALAPAKASKPAPARLADQCHKPLDFFPIGDGSVPPLAPQLAGRSGPARTFLLAGSVFREVGAPDLSPAGSDPSA